MLGAGGLLGLCRPAATLLRCADDLHEVTELLSDGIQDLRQTEVALVHAQNALVDVEAALQVSQDKENEATERSLHYAATDIEHDVKVNNLDPKLLI